MINCAETIALHCRYKAHGSKFLGSEQVFQTETNITKAKAIFIDRVRECVEFWKNLHDDVKQIKDRKVADRCIQELWDCLFEVQGLGGPGHSTFYRPEYHEAVGNGAPGMSTTGLSPG